MSPRSQDASVGWRSSASLQTGILRWAVAANLLLLLLCLPSLEAASGKSPATKETYGFRGPGRDGKPRSVEVTLTNRPVNTVDPGQNADDDENYGRRYKRVAPADTRYNCAGDVSNVLFDTGEKNFNVSDFRKKIILPFGRVVQRPQTKDVVIFGNDAHIAVITALTKDPNVVIIRSKDNQESVREGPMSLDPAKWDDDPIINKNGDPSIYRVPSDKMKVHRVDGRGPAADRSSAREVAKDAAKDAARDAGRQAAREASRQSGKETAKEPAKKAGKDATREASKGAHKPSVHHHP